MHAIAAFFWRHKLRALARFWSNLTRFLTGIEIHPGAKIGKRLFIDHGMGVVIGETAVVGDDVTLYQGATLGGLGKSDEDGKRHPTLENEVMIGAGAHILGPITIGSKAKVGANAVVTKDVPAGCTAVGNPARFVDCESKAPAYGLPRSKHLDPVGETIESLREEIAFLRSRLESDSAKNVKKIK
jgi:serine O-acetyltransferase